MTRRWTLIFSILFAAACGAQQSDEENVASGEGDTGMETSSAEVITTDSGLQYIVLETGDGDAIASGSTAVVHYTGWLYDESAEDNKGEQFDSSRDRGQTFGFPLGAGRVIRGWDEGVAGMQVGERRILIIAPELGYGARGAGGAIPPGATLIFDVELVSIQ